MRFLVDLKGIEDSTMILQHTFNFLKTLFSASYQSTDYLNLPSLSIFSSTSPKLNLNIVTAFNLLRLHRTVCDYSKNRKTFENVNRLSELPTVNFPSSEG